MNNDQRFSSFFSRVEFEREILRAVNQLPNLKKPLHGLSPAARSEWLRVLPESLRESGIQDLLSQCWDEMGGMADHSRNVFETRPAGIENSRKLADAIQALLKKE